MRCLLIITLLLAGSGCSLTPTQQKVAGVVLSVLVVGAYAAHEADSGKPAGQDRSIPGAPCDGLDRSACL